MMRMDHGRDWKKPRRESSKTSRDNGSMRGSEKFSRRTSSRACYNKEEIVRLRDSEILQDYHHKSSEMKRKTHETAKVVSRKGFRRKRKELSHLEKEIELLEKRKSRRSRKIAKERSTNRRSRKEIP